MTEASPAYRGPQFISLALLSRGYLPSPGGRTSLASLASLTSLASLASLTSLACLTSLASLASLASFQAGLRCLARRSPVFGAIQIFYLAFDHSSG